MCHFPLLRAGEFIIRYYGDLIKIGIPLGVEPKRPDQCIRPSADRFIDNTIQSTILKLLINTIFLNDR